MLGCDGNLKDLSIDYFIVLEFQNFKALKSPFNPKKTQNNPLLLSQSHYPHQSPSPSTNSKSKKKDFFSAKKCQQRENIERNIWKLFLAAEFHLSSFHKQLLNSVRRKKKESEAEIRFLLWESWLLHNVWKLFFFFFFEKKNIIITTAM